MKRQEYGVKNVPAVWNCSPSEGSCDTSGELVDNQWHVCPAHTTIQILNEIKKFIEHFQDKRKVPVLSRFVARQNYI